MLKKTFNTFKRSLLIATILTSSLLIACWGDDDDNNNGNNNNGNNNNGKGNSYEKGSHSIPQSDFYGEWEYKKGKDEADIIINETMFIMGYQIGHSGGRLCFQLKVGHKL